MSNRHTIAWNKGLTKKTDERIALGAKKLRKTLRETPRVAWNKGLNKKIDIRCARSEESCIQSGITFKKRYKKGLIASRQGRSGYNKLPAFSWYACYYTKEDGSILRVRSGWEKTFCQLLDNIEANWWYEPKTFKLSNGTHYTPDFKVVYPKRLQWMFGCKEEYIEIKGWWYKGSQEKVECFKRDFPRLRLRVIDAASFSEILAIKKGRLSSQNKAIYDQLVSQGLVNIGGLYVWRPNCRK
jgi:hypothetical protein